ncbi:hypothetical protein JCM17960_15960 [Magnetospira thiophila]
MRMYRTRTLFGVLVLGVLLGGCQTMSGIQEDLQKLGLSTRSAVSSTTPSSERSETELDSAAVLAQAQKDLEGLNWPQPQETWTDLRNVLDRTRTNLQDLAGAPESESVRQRLRSFETQLRQDAPTLFARHDLIHGRSFLKIYPIDLDGPTLFDAQWGSLYPKLQNASLEDLSHFASTYSRTDLGAAHRKELVQMFTERLKSRNKGRDDLETLLANAELAKSAGFEGAELDSSTIGFVEATSKTLLRERQVDFPASVDVDLPVNSEKLSLDEAITPYDGNGPRFIVVFEVALAKATRRVMSLKEVPSVVFIGNRYGTGVMTADGRVVEDVKDPTTGTTSPSVNPLAMEDYGITERRAVGEPVAYRYSFSLADIRSRKNMTVNYYIVDRKRRDFFKSTFDAFEEQRYNVAYNVLAGDPKRNRLDQDYDTEQEIDDFESGPLAVSLSQLLTHYKNNRDKQNNRTSLSALRQVLQRDRNAALANYKANTFDARPLNDPRFDSVVAVYTGKRGMGSGFFVAPDIVLTNWHVVENQKVVEMKMYDGRETYGTVLAKDVRLDVALVKVQDRGRPVAFYTGRDLSPGMEADVIGHPYRHLFSITRGIVSAIRKEPSINLPGGAGDEVLFVQTDAPINGGNSGGPLFHGNKVIGMNTWGYLGTDGLGFSVHYAEILNYLNEHLSGFHVDPAGRS